MVGRNTLLTAAHCVAPGTGVGQFFSLRWGGASLDNGVRGAAPYGTFSGAGCWTIWAKKGWSNKKKDFYDFAAVDLSACSDNPTSKGSGWLTVWSTSTTDPLRGKTVYEYGYPASGDVCPAATGRDELGTGSAYPQNCGMSGTANTITYRSGLDWRWFSYNLDTSGGQSGTPGYVFSDRQYRTVGPLEGLNSKRVSARRIDGLVVVRSRKPVYSAATVVRAMAALCRVPRKCVLIGRRL